MITIEEIQAAGEVPASFYNIAPGKAIFYVPSDGVSSKTQQLVIDLYRRCSAQHEDFRLKIEVESTSNRLLEGSIVAKRLNLGSLYQYNLLMARIDCKESVEAFVEEFFNLASRDDEALKFIDKNEPHGRWEPARPRYDGFDESSFAPTGMTLGMIIMNPAVQRNDDENDEVMATAKNPEQIEEDNRLIREILNYACKDHEEVALELLERLAPRIYTRGDCRLVCTEDYELLLKAGTTVAFDLTKREAALYLFLLAHPKGIEKKRIADYRDEIADYYFILHKKPNSDKVDKTIDNLVAFKETRDGYKMNALDQCISRINTELDACIMNRTSQLPFIVQNTDGVLHVDLPRKYFEWLVKEVKFIIQD